MIFPEAQKNAVRLHVEGGGTDQCTDQCTSASVKQTISDPIYNLKPHQNTLDTR